MSRYKVAIIGSGNIGTDLMYKIKHSSSDLELMAMAGIDPQSDGLRHARNLGISVTHHGVEGLVDLPGFDSVQLVFDSSSAKIHEHHHRVLTARGKRLIDLTPAALGPFVVPVVNFDSLRNEPNLNMVSCGGQATIPIVAAVRQIAKVRYAEIVCSLASVSAGPGTRANIDEFTTTTSRAIERVGGAVRAKAIIILNPAEPPLLMRNTVFVLSEETDEALVRASVERVVSAVQQYVPGYRLKQEVLFEHFGSRKPMHIPGYGTFHGLKTSVFLEVAGSAHYLPAYAGNLDIMTSAALATAERVCTLRSVPGDDSELI